MKRENNTPEPAVWKITEQNQGLEKKSMRRAVKVRDDPNWRKRENKRLAKCNRGGKK